MPKYKELRANKDLLAKQVAQAAGVDEGLYSKFENHRALPIPAEFRKILDVLECAPADVYDPDEVTLLPSESKTAGGSRAYQPPEKYKMTVRLGNASRAILTKEVLRKCGYKSINDWVKACVMRLKSQYEHICKTEKEKPRQPSTGGTSGAGTRRGIPLTYPEPTNILSNKTKNVKEAIPQ